MPDSRFNSWMDFIIDEEGYDRINANPDAVVGISEANGANSERRITIESLMKNPR